ncbi:MAG: rhodanese-like domain-containing protein [Casimicrobiaceae bacterium]|nr:rhodanese-like domain-containing protein [Casimicrobiaceae bacterium]MCX8097930.1 rhodanese-like domain-containing protein [Casimicrobiaceae bacterium]MDW8312871.1 rhodanese-like domain-containing protein [Burkholderiales bacterium]
MNKRGIALAVTVGAFWLCLVPGPVAAQASEAQIEDLVSFFEFSDDAGGMLLPRQVTPELRAGMIFVDVRPRAQYARSRIPGARHMDWKQVLKRRAEFPKDKTVVFYCNTGAHSSQVAFAMRYAGWERALVLVGGLEAWKAHGHALDEQPLP